MRHRVPTFTSTTVALGSVLAILTLSSVPGATYAQEPADSLQAELARLRARLDSLEALVRRLEAQGREEEAGDVLEELRAAADAAAEAAPSDTAGEGQEPDFAGRQRSLQALNPEISMNVDLFGHLNVDDTDDQNFVPREFELSFQSALDPFSRAKVFVTHHAVGPELFPFEEGHGHEGEGEGGEEAEEGGVEIEEGYVEWVGLPGGVSLKLGRFFQRFGTLNRWHAHALPFQSRSLPHLAFIGEESLSQTGASASVLLPFGGSAGTYEATLEFTRSSNESLFAGSTGPSTLGHLNAFWQLTPSTDLDLGVSWINGDLEDEEHAFDRNLFGVETAFTWRPPGRSRYRELVFRGGAMVLDGLVAPEESPQAGDDGEGVLDDQAWGFWSLAEFKFSRQWRVGARFDWTENPGDTDQTAWVVSPTLTWWQSEWVRLRLEYDALQRSFVTDDEGRLWLQVTFAMGPHKHETY